MNSPSHILVLQYWWSKLSLHLTSVKDYIFLRLCLSVSICLYLCLSVSICLYLCVCLHLSLRLCLSCLSLSVSVCLCLSLSCLPPSVCLSLSVQLVYTVLPVTLSLHLFLRHNRDPWFAFESLRSTHSERLTTARIQTDHANIMSIICERVMKMSEMMKDQLGE